MEKANVYNSSICPMHSECDPKANALRESILNAKDALPKNVTGNIWYISEDGKDSNSGDSKDAPWATIDALNKNVHRICEGDAVLFCRGGIYRGSFICKSGVYYGAYGSGNKPCIYGSKQNYAAADCWKKESDNIWVCTAPMQNDVGITVFDDGKLIGYKKPEKGLMECNGDFWCDRENGNTLYVYMDKNPAEVFGSIEIGTKLTMIGIYDGTHNVTIENLCVKYTGSHAVATCNGVKDVTVRNCEFGMLGGSYLSGTLRYGNAVEFYGACENILVENNWIYQIYDSGITHQGPGNYVAKNLTYRNNLIEYCGMGSIEYWLAYNKSKGDYNYAENVTYADNIMRFAGYCWGGAQRPDKVSAHILSNGANQNRYINYNIINNIFDNSTHDLLEITSLDETYPVLAGNTYIQKEGMRLGSFADKRDVVFDRNISKTLKEDWGETEPTVIYD